MGPFRLTEISSRPTEAVVDLGALSRNLAVLRSAIGPAAIMAIVKANAYGHGSADCAARLAKDGIEYFGVATVEEALELREAGIVGSIVILGSIYPGQESAVIRHGLEPMVCAPDIARSLSAAAVSFGTKVDVHIKIDTGMSRLGIDPSETREFAAYLAEQQGLCVKGIMTHFPSADDQRHDAFTRSQIDVFDHCCREIIAAGHTPQYFDLANSPGALALPDSRKNLVRLGGGLYGLLDDIMRGHPALPVLEPVMQLRSAIAYIRSIEPGKTVGYGRTFTAARPTRLAAVPIGYADGYPRALSNRGTAIIRGQFAPVAGLVSMDWTVFDVTDIADAMVGDDVILMGTSDGLSVTAADIAEICGTIGYEITCGISKRVPRRSVR